MMAGLQVEVSTSPTSLASSSDLSDDEYSSNSSNGEAAVEEYIDRLTEDSRQRLIRKMQSLKRNHNPLIPISQRCCANGGNLRANEV